MKIKSIKDIVNYFLNPGNMLSCPPVEAAVEVVKFIFPNRSKNEKKTRQADRRAVARGELGEPVKREPEFVDGKPNLNKITMGVSIWNDQIPITEETVKYIYDAGFELIVCPFDESENRDRLVELAKKYDIAVLIENHSLPPKGSPLESLTDTSIFDGIVHEDNVLAVYGWDEPNKNDFERIGRYTELFDRAFSKVVMFNNLFPACCSQQQYGTKSYLDYVESYAKAVPGNIVSVDIYPFYSFRLMNFFGAFQALQTYDTLGYVCRKYNKEDRKSVV